MLNDKILVVKHNSPSSTGANILPAEKWCKYWEEGTPRGGGGGGGPGRPGGKSEPGGEAQKVDGEAGGGKQPEQERFHEKVHLCI